MKTLQIHFDELLLTLLFVFLVVVWIWKPEAKEWAGGALAALIMALRNKGQETKNESTEQERKKI